MIKTRNIGRIGISEVKGDNNIQTLTVIIAEGYHTSYHMAFECNGTYYMVPEIAENKSINLYE